MSDEQLKKLQDAPLANIQEALANVSSEEMETVARKLYNLKLERIIELEAENAFLNKRMGETRNPEEKKDWYAEIHHNNNSVYAENEVMDYLRPYCNFEEEKTAGSKQV